MRAYNLSTLIHELVYFIAHQCEVIDCEFTEDIPAYITEGIITKLIIISREVQSRKGLFTKKATSHHGSFLLFTSLSTFFI